MPRSATFALVVAAGTTASAQVTWDGSTGNMLWFDARNWTPERVPGAADDAVIMDSEVIIQAGSAEVGSINQTGSQPLRLAGNATLSINGPSSIARFGIGGPLATLATLELTGSGGLSTSRWSGPGPVINTGDFTFHPQSSYGNGTPLVFENRGIARARSFHIQAGSEFSNLPGGQLLLEASDVGGAVIGGGLWNRGGEIIVDGKTIGMQGPVNQESGKLIVRNGGDWVLQGLQLLGGTVELTEDSVLRGTAGGIVIDGQPFITGNGSFFFDQASRFDAEIIRSDVTFDLKFTGGGAGGLVITTDGITFEGGATLTTLGRLDWNFGSLGGHGTIINYGLALGANALNIDAHNFGTWSTGTNFTMDAGVTMENDGELKIGFGVGAGVGGGRIVNRAMLELGADVTDAVIGVRVEQTAGTTIVNDRVVRLEDSSEFSGGVIQLDFDGAVPILVFGGTVGDSHVFSGLPQIKGDESIGSGRCVFAGASATLFHIQAPLEVLIDDDSADGGFVLQNGDVLLDAPLTIDCEVALWRGGTLRGPTSAINKRNLRVEGGALKAALENRGAVTHTGAVVASGVGQIINRAGARYDFQSGALTASQPFQNEGAARLGVDAPVSFGITGPFTQTASGELDMELGGPLPGSGYDQLAATGPVILDGALRVRVIDGWTLSLGDRYEIIRGGSITGAFSSTELPPLSNDLEWKVSYEPMSVALEVILPCYADCDGDMMLDIFDFLCFQNAFQTGDLSADCDGTGELDFFDFLCFQSEFATGCP